MCGSFIRSGAVILLLPLSFSLPRTGAQEMRQNSDKYMSLWFICGKKELIIKISKSTLEHREVISDSMHVYMDGILGKSVACEIYSPFFSVHKFLCSRSHF